MASVTTVGAARHARRVAQANERGDVLDVEVRTGGLDLINVLTPEWLALCDANPAFGIDQRPEAFAIYLECHKPGAVAMLVTVREAGSLVAVLPLVAERRRYHGLSLRWLRPIGDLVSPGPFDLAHLPDRRAEAVRAVWGELKSRRTWNALELVAVPEGSALEELVALAKGDGYPVASRLACQTPYVPIPAGADPERLGESNAKFRANLRRRLRNLEAIGPVRVERDTAFVPELLDRFFALEASGWKGREGTAITASGAERDYFVRLAQAAADGGYLTIYSLLCGDATIAMHFGATINGRYEVPKLAFDEAWSAYAPGHLLVQEVLRDCLARGITEFDFLGNEMPWKLEWTTLVRRYHRHFVFRPGSVGHGAYALRFRLLPWGKRLAGRVSGLTRGAFDRA